MFAKFKKWLKNACETHPQLLHQDIEGSKVFFVANVEREDVITDFEVKEGGFVVVLMFPESEVHYNMPMIKHDFVVFIGHPSNSTMDEAAMEEAMLKCNKLWVEFMVKLRNDEEMSRSFYGSGDNQLFTPRITPVFNYYPNYSGYLWQQSIAERIPSDMLQQTGWTESGVTDLDIFN